MNSITFIYVFSSFILSEYIFQVKISFKTDKALWVYFYWFGFREKKNRWKPVKETLFKN